MAIPRSPHVSAGGMASGSCRSAGNTGAVDEGLEASTSDCSGIPITLNSLIRFARNLALAAECSFDKTKVFL